MRLNKILVVGCLMLGFPAASLSAPFNSNDLFSVKSGPDASGAFARTSATIANTDKAIEARNLINLANAKIAKEPGNDKYYAARAQCYRDLSEFKPALADINRAIQINSKNQTYFLFRAAVNGLQNDFQTSLVDIDRAILLGPADAQVYLVKSDCVMALGRYADGLQAAEKSILIRPTAEGYAYSGLARYFLNDFKGAQADLTKAEPLNSKNNAMVSKLRQMLATNR